MSNSDCHRGMFAVVRRTMLVLLGTVLLAGPVAAVETMSVYKSSTCGCCKGWVKHMRDNGFTVQASNVDNVMPFKEHYKVPQNMMSCHTAVIGNYVIEGHVPAQDVSRLLREHPAVTGLAAPGMPVGSPGMPGSPSQAYQVVSFDAQGRLKVYAQY